MSCSEMLNAHVETLDYCRQVGQRYLNETLVTAEKTFLISIQNGNERYFRQIQAFAKEVDAYKHIIHTCAQGALGAQVRAPRQLK